MEKWIEDHNGKDLCVAYTDINNDLAYLCLKENKEQKLPNQKSATKAEYKIENTTENSSNTPSSNDGDYSNIGCIVLSVILAVAALILSILRTDSDTFASIGTLVMFAVCAIAGYFIYKFTGSSKSTGCLPTIIGFIAFVFLFNVIGYNYEVNTTIGIIVFVIVFVIGLIYFLSRLNKR
jgi:K+-sensing histidine kinase KdpD